jgi:hypothetical protein
VPGKWRFATFGMKFQCSSQASGQVSLSIHMPNDTSSIWHGDVPLADDFDSHSLTPSAATAYVVPTVLTLAVKPSFEPTGSGPYDGQDDWERRGGEWEDHNGSQHLHEEPKKNSKKH